MNIPSPLNLHISVEHWPIRGSFAISRGSKTEAVVVVAELDHGQARGRGECVPYARYGESVESVCDSLDAMRPQLTAGLTRSGLQGAMPAGAARNALDCAFWDLEAKRSHRPVHAIAGLSAPRPLTTAYTLSLDTAAAMADAAGKAAQRSLLKVKLGADGDPARIAEVRAAAPRATLIVDANEGWNDDNLAANLAACAEAGVALIEQPLPDGRDNVLAGTARRIPLCADESAHDRGSLARLREKYDVVNIKLDKAGGLTEALAMAESAEGLGFALMVGSMVATSLALAPAVLVAQKARYVDLDGPLLLARDRPDGLVYHDSEVDPPVPALWG